MRSLLIAIAALIMTACTPKDDPFAPFRSAVSTHFAPVAARFGLAPGPEKRMDPELHIEFHGKAARLGISHELGSGPWVAVVVTTAGGHERHFGLHTIVEQREGSTRSFDELEKAGDLDTQVRMLADLTRKHAGSLLEKRTTNLRELYLLSRKRLQERERAAGFPRVPHPTLPQLFEACRPNTRAICAYHAVVDNDYTTDDVAAFLRVGSSDVQRMLDEHDTLR